MNICTFCPFSSGILSGTDTEAAFCPRRADSRENALFPAPGAPLPAPPKKASGGIGAAGGAYALPVMRLNMKRLAPLWAALFLLSACAPRADPVSAPQEDIRVALTFDDGPHGVCTPRLLEGLAERGVRATFFLIGSQAAEHRELVEEMAAAGHQIGNHSYDHGQLDRMGCEAALGDIQRCDRLLQEILGAGIYWVRPPYGIISRGECAAVAAPLVTWSVDPEDWRVQDEDAVVRAVEENISDGAIVLLHDPYPTTVAAALRIVDDLLAQGVRFCTLEELFACRGVVPELGRIYRRA